MFGRQLRALRKQRNMSQQELEAASGVAQEYISSLERGTKSNPSPEVITSLAAGLRVPVADLARAVWEEGEVPSLPAPAARYPAWLLALWDRLSPGQRQEVERHAQWVWERDLATEMGAHSEEEAVLPVKEGAIGYQRPPEEEDERLAG